MKELRCTPRSSRFRVVRRFGIAEIFKILILKPFGACISLPTHCRYCDILEGLSVLPVLGVKSDAIPVHNVELDLNCCPGVQ